MFISAYLQYAFLSGSCSALPANKVRLRFYTLVSMALNELFSSASIFQSALLRLGGLGVFTRQRLLRFLDEYENCDKYNHACRE